MQFALPPRKTSHPPPYERVFAKSAASQRRRKLQTIGYGIFSVLTIYLLVRWLRGGVQTRHGDSILADNSSVLIVTVLDDSVMSEDYMRMIKANRDDYAAQHGYRTFYTNTSTYSHHLETSPSSWAMVPALRHALTLNPDVDFLWSLSPHALITNTSLSLHGHILSRLSTLMRKDVPVVPPDSVIHTFSHLRPASAFLILTQDIDNIAHTSFLLRNTQTIPVPHNKAPETWTQFLLDAWFDPLYRSYSFQKAENHALEHIIQWHPTILAKVVLIEQRLLNSYNYQSPTIVDADTKQKRTHDSMWRPGDLLVNFKGCVEARERDCEREMRKYFRSWVGVVKQEDGRDIKMEFVNEDYTAPPPPPELTKQDSVPNTSDKKNKVKKLKTKGKSKPRLKGEDPPEDKTGDKEGEQKEEVIAAAAAGKEPADDNKQSTKEKSEEE